MTNIPIEMINDLIIYLKKTGWLDTKNLSDRYYKVRELYEHRLILFKIILHTYPDLAWKSKRHYEDEMFNGDFIAGITTPIGNASYHFKLDRYDEFNIRELERAPKYDNYTPEEALARINTLPSFGEDYHCTNMDLLSTYKEYYTYNIDYSKEEEKIAIAINQLLLALKETEILKTIDITVGYHDFKELYKQRRELYKLICHAYSDLAWKTRFDINCQKTSNDTAIIGLNTPLGPMGFILNDEYYDSFKIKEIKTAPICKSEIYKGVTKKLSSIKIRNPR